MTTKSVHYATGRCVTDKDVTTSSSINSTHARNDCVKFTTFGKNIEDELVQRENSQEVLNETSAAWANVARRQALTSSTSGDAAIWSSSAMSYSTSSRSLYGVYPSASSSFDKAKASPPRMKRRKKKISQTAAIAECETKSSAWSESATSECATFNKQEGRNEGGVGVGKDGGRGGDGSKWVCSMQQEKENIIHKGKECAAEKIETKLFPDCKSRDKSPTSPALVDLENSDLYNRRKQSWRGHSKTMTPERDVSGTSGVSKENFLTPDIGSGGSIQSSPDVTSEADEKESGYVTLEDLQAQKASEDEESSSGGGRAGERGDDDSGLSSDDAKKESRPSRDIDYSMRAYSCKSPKELVALKSPRNLSGSPRDYIRSPRELKSPRNAGAARSPKEFSSSPKGDASTLRFTFTVKLDSKMFNRRQRQKAMTLSGGLGGSGGAGLDEVEGTTSSASNASSTSSGDAEDRVLKGRVQLLTPDVTVINFAVRTDDLGAENGGITAASAMRNDNAEDGEDAYRYEPINVRAPSAFNFPPTSIDTESKSMFSAQKLPSSDARTVKQAVRDVSDMAPVAPVVKSVSFKDMHEEMVDGTVTDSKYFENDMNELMNSIERKGTRSTTPTSILKVGRPRLAPELPDAFETSHAGSVDVNQKELSSKNSITPATTETRVDVVGDFENGTYLKPVEVNPLPPTVSLPPAQILPDTPQPNVHVWANVIEKNPSLVPRWQRLDEGRKARRAEPLPVTSNVRTSEKTKSPSEDKEDGDYKVTHMSWTEVIEEAKALGIPLHQPAGSSSSTSTMNRNHVKRSTSVTQTQLDEDADGMPCQKAAMSIQRAASSSSSKQSSCGPVNCRPCQLKVSRNQSSVASTTTEKFTAVATTPGNVVAVPMCLQQQQQKDELIATKQRKSLKELFSVHNLFSANLASLKAAVSERSGRAAEKKHRNSHSVPPSRSHNQLSLVSSRRRDKQSALSPLSPNASLPGGCVPSRARGTQSRAGVHVTSTTSDFPSIGRSVLLSPDCSMTRSVPVQCCGSRDEKVQSDWSTKTVARENYEGLKREEHGGFDECDGNTLPRAGARAGASVSEGKRFATTPLSPTTPSGTLRTLTGSLQTRSSTGSGSKNKADFIQSLGQLQSCGWYWGALGMDDAEAKLANKPDGTFLVRDSSDERYILSLSFRSLGGTHHTRIEHYKGKFSFYCQPQSSSDDHVTIVEFIEKSMEACGDGRCLYYLRPRGPGLPAAPVQLLYPLSRYRCMHSLKHLCKFAVLRHVRVDLIDRLPISPRLKEYVKDSQCVT